MRYSFIREVFFSGEYGKVFFLCGSIWLVNTQNAGITSNISARRFRIGGTAMTEEEFQTYISTVPRYNAVQIGEKILWDTCLPTGDHRP